jgi:hypothetical protein
LNIGYRSLKRKINNRGLLKLKGSASDVRNVCTTSILYFISSSL